MSPFPAPASIAPRVVAQRQEGLIILAPADRRPHRRVFYINSYGGEQIWNQVQHGELPSHHLWGCVQLAAQGYEVALGEPVPDFYWRRRPLPHDFRYYRFLRAWLRRDDIVFCGHNVLYWLPLLTALGALRCRVVSQLFAREPLDWGRGHAGVIALTPAAEQQARRLAPHARIAHLGWGCDLSAYPASDYDPKWFLSCGTTNRDHRTLLGAANRTRQPLRLICGMASAAMDWPRHVTIVRSDWPKPEARVVHHRELCEEHYRHAAAAIVVLKPDPTEYTACGFTELLEVMALGKPVIVTRTGALPGEIDVERAGCGLHVPAGDPAALADAMEQLARNPDAAAAMGRAGRALSERHYNMDRYASDLERFFSSL